MNKTEKMSQMARLRHKFLTPYFAKRALAALFRYVFLLAVVYVIFYPLFVQLMSTFMSVDDLHDRTVQLIPATPTLANYPHVINATRYWEAFRNSMILAFTVAVIQTLVSSLVGYGFAKFKFRGRNILFAFVLVTLLVPPHTMLTSMFLYFRFFDFWGLLSLIGRPIRLTGTFAPMFILAATGLGLISGLYIFVMRQFYRGVPDELLDAAYIDGAGVYGTYGRIILPLSVTPMLTVFLLSFAWQWTDTFYSGMFFGGIHLLPNIMGLIPAELFGVMERIANMLLSVRLNTAMILIILPLVILYLLTQRYFIQGIERSGITG